MTDDGLFAPIFTTDALLEATGTRAWLQAMLDVERALSEAAAALDLIPAEAASAIAPSCVAERFDAARLGREGRLGGNPVIPLVAALRAAVPPEASDWVHWGATSQDILDTAAMLVCQRSMSLIDRDLDGLAAGCADLAAHYRDTLMVGRTLLQHALPITFGLKAAGWLQATLDARHAMNAARARLSVQLGGAVGTLAAFGGRGTELVARLASDLHLVEPTLPWHAARQRVAEVGAALGLVAGTAAKIGRDVALMMQTEVAESAEPGGDGRGGSSTMPHKRNPVGAAAISAAARRAHALLPVLFAAMEAEHERAAGAWHAEWETLNEMLRLSGGAAARARETVAGLEVDPVRMAANLSLTGGVILSERVAMALTERAGRQAAVDAVRRAAQRTADNEGSFADELLAETDVAVHLAPGELDDLLDPASYVGAAGELVDRVLDAYRREDS